ncbi:MAG: transposase [Muribaculaceae bacterium]|nr:transposase [Muribaculaceae bacterium]
MANTYINIYLHIVFAVKYRDACIDGSWRERLYAYISSIFKAKEQFVVKIGGVSDHIHMLISYNAKVPLPDLIRDVKFVHRLRVRSAPCSPVANDWYGRHAAAPHPPSPPPSSDTIIRRHHPTPCTAHENPGTRVRGSASRGQDGHGRTKLHPPTPKEQRPQSGHTNR